MTTVIPEGEAVRKAVKWISDTTWEYFDPLVFWDEFMGILEGGHTVIQIKPDGNPIVSALKNAHSTGSTAEVFSYQD